MAAKRHEPTWPEMLLMLAGVVVLAPIVLPFTLWQDSHKDARMKAAALLFRCEACGQILGQASLDRAESEWRAALDKLFLDNPGVRFRLKQRDVHATCVRCDEAYSFDERETTFRPLKERRQRLSDVVGLSPELL